MSLKKLRGFDPILTKYSMGYSNEESIGQEIFQNIPSVKEAGEIPQFGKDSFKEYTTLRAVGGASNARLRSNYEPIPFILQEHDIYAPLDYREADESLFDEKAAIIEENKDILALQQEIAVATIVTDSTNYSTGNAVALSGTSKLSDPDCQVIELVQTAKEAIRKKIGMNPMHGWIDAASYAALRTNAQIKATLSNDSTKIPTNKDLCTIFGLDALYVGRMVKSSDAGVLSDVWGTNFGIFYKRKSSSKYKPNFGYIINKSKNGEFVDTFGDDPKIKNYRSTKIYVPKQTSEDCGFLYSETL